MSTLFIFNILSQFYSPKVQKDEKDRYSLCSLRHYRRVVFFSLMFKRGSLTLNFNILTFTKCQLLSLQNDTWVLMSWSAWTIVLMFLWSIYSTLDLDVLTLPSYWDGELAGSWCISHLSTGLKIIIVIITLAFMKSSKWLIGLTASRCP